MKNLDEYTQGSIRIPKKAMIGIAPGVAIIAIIISKGDFGALMLFIAGIGVGVLTCRGYLEGNKQEATPEE